MDEEFSSDKIYPVFEYARGRSQRAVWFMNFIIMWFCSGLLFSVAWVSIL